MLQKKSFMAHSFAKAAFQQLVNSQRQGQQHQEMNVCHHKKNHKGQ
jgi:hypothetical protein